MASSKLTSKQKGEIRSGKSQYKAGCVEYTYPPPTEPPIYQYSSLPNKEPTTFVFSNFHTAPFYCDQIHYRSSEQYYQANKAQYIEKHQLTLKSTKEAAPGFEYGKVRQAVMSYTGASDMAKVTRNFVESDAFTAEWQTKKGDVLLRANWCKYFQNPDEREYLLGTGSRLIVKAAKDDFECGVGFFDVPGPTGAEHNRAHWGQNLHGRALMEVRHQLRLCLARDPDYFKHEDQKFTTHLLTLYSPRHKFVPGMFDVVGQRTCEEQHQQALREIQAPPKVLQDILTPSDREAIERTSQIARTSTPWHRKMVASQPQDQGQPAYQQPPQQQTHPQQPMFSPTPQGLFKPQPTPQPPPQTLSPRDQAYLQWLEQTGRMQPGLHRLPDSGLITIPPAQGRQTGIISEFAGGNTGAPAQNSLEVQSVQDVPGPSEMQKLAEQQAGYMSNLSELRHKIGLHLTSVDQISRQMTTMVYAATAMTQQIMDPGRHVLDIEEADHMVPQWDEIMRSMNPGLGKSVKARLLKEMQSRTVLDPVLPMARIRTKFNKGLLIMRKLKEELDDVPCEGSALILSKFSATTTIVARSVVRGGWELRERLGKKEHEYWHQFATMQQELVDLGTAAGDQLKRLHEEVPDFGSQNPTQRIQSAWKRLTSRMDANSLEMLVADKFLDESRKLKREMMAEAIYGVRDLGFRLQQWLMGVTRQRKPMLGDLK